MITLHSIFTNLAGLLAYDAEHPMLFSSGLFWAAFLVFLPLFAWLRRSRVQMVVFTVLFSLFFYYESSGWFMVMLVVTASVDWLLSKAIAVEPEQWKRRLCVALSLTLSLGVLAYFKYANFFKWNWDMMVVGNYQPLDIVLPVGISFYTFQSVSYMVDVYLLQDHGAAVVWRVSAFLVLFPGSCGKPDCEG